MNEINDIEQEQTQELELEELESGINLATIALLPNSVKALREHRKRHLCVYEKVIRNKTELTRFYSDEPSICVGLYVQENFTPPEKDWVFLYPLYQENAGEGNALWYGLHVIDGQIHQEHIATLSKLARIFAYNCAQSARVYLPNVDDLTQILTNATLSINKDKIGVAPTINLQPQKLIELPQKYKTKSAAKLTRPLLIGLVLALFIGGGIAAVILNKPKPKVVAVKKVDPLAMWVTQLNQTPLASPTLLEAQDLLSRGYLLPHDYKAALLKSSQDTLTLKVGEVFSPANRQTLALWLSRYKAATEQWDSDLSQLTATPPLAPPDMPTTSINGIPEHLYSQLRHLGANTLTITKNPNQGKVESREISAKFNNASISIFSHVADITQSKPIFVKSMTVTPHETTADVTFTLLILGITS